MSREHYEREFSKKEIWEGLKQCDKDKAQGPNRFNMGFIQELWHIITGDITEAFKELHENGTFLKSSKFSFMVFIPKVERAENMRDFMPISLVTCIYKLISKLLARRMPKVLG